jgi:hypothetical protein
LLLVFNNVLLLFYGRRALVSLLPDARSSKLLTDPAARDPVCGGTVIIRSGTPFLMFIPRAFVLIAIAAWAVTFTGLVRSLIKPFGASTR